VRLTQWLVHRESESLKGTGRAVLALGIEGSIGSTPSARGSIIEKIVENDDEVGLFDLRWCVRPPFLVFSTVATLAGEYCNRPSSGGGCSGGCEDREPCCRRPAHVEL
jgi:hypothetical protein